MIKKICATILILVAMSLSVSAAEKILDAAVFDNSQTLSKSEIQNLTRQIESVEQKHGVKIGVEFLKTIGNRDIASAARELLSQHYSNAQNGGIIFLVVMDSRSWYVATDSRLQNFVNANDVGNYLLPSLKNGDYYGACSAYIEAVDKSMTYYEQNGAAYDSTGGFNPMAAMLAIVMGIFFGVMVRSWLMGTMSNVHHEVKATDYLKRETVKFVKNRDTYLFTNVERRPKPQSSNNHAMGHSGGGGGHSGGGGAGGSF